MKLERFLVYVQIIPRPGDELEQRTLFMSLKYEVPLFKRVMIEAKDATFVDDERRVIQRADLINRLWKYFGQDSVDLLHEKTLDDYFEHIRLSAEDPTRMPLEGFWIRVTGEITCLEGGDHYRDEPDFTIELPMIHVLAERIEFEVRPRRWPRPTDDRERS